jgi:hypothetical protein
MRTPLARITGLVSGTQTFPRIQTRLLTTATRTPQPVLASAQALADIGNAGFGTLTANSAIAPVRVWVDGVLSGTPAAPGAAAFVIMPVTAIHGFAGPLPRNELLITGTNIDMARPSAIVRKMLPGAAMTLRSDILKGLADAPLQHGTFVLFELSIAVAAALGLAVMLLELALGARERVTTLARLAAMGLGEGPRARVVTLEGLPAVIAAAVAAAACALILPRVVRPHRPFGVHGIVRGHRAHARRGLLRAAARRAGRAGGGRTRHGDQVRPASRRGGEPSGRRIMGAR